MARILSEKYQPCRGIGKIKLIVSGNETISKDVKGEEVSIPPTEILLQRFDDGSTRVRCDYLSNGQGNPEEIGGCLKIYDACRSNCFRILAGLPAPKDGHDTAQGVLPCKWVVGSTDDLTKK
jgi:hypothetical protein